MKNKVKAFLMKLKGDDKLVVSLVLIAVAVGLCILFREQINTMMKAMFTSMTATITNLYAGTVTPTP